MMPFLKQVANHYFAEGNIREKCFVFPNRRSLVFFRKYLQDAVKASGAPIQSPQMFTMNDFFYRVADVGSADKVALLLELYRCYSKYNPAEKLDDFIFWGDVILSDFDDVDKYLADPAGVFANIADCKSIQDDYSYLSENQREAISQFMSHFETGGRVKEDFRKIWDVLGQLYTDFNASLKEKGISYEGQVYRTVAQTVRDVPVVDILSKRFEGVDKFVFVGLNTLNKCERLLLLRMNKAGVAEFNWDYQSGMIRDKDNRSSFFMEGNLADFPQAFDLEALESPVPKISLLSVPSSVGQAKMLEGILPADAGIDTAVVIPDESLLMPVLNSIPESIRDINVTMGYPMSGSQLFALMNEVLALQMHTRTKDGEDFFYHGQVWAILSNSLFRSVVGEEGLALIDEIKKNSKYYIPEKDFAGNEFFGKFFRKVGDIPALEDYLLDIVSSLAVRIRDDRSMALELDFARDYYEAVVSLRKYELPVTVATFAKLVSQLTASRSVPFVGEPLNGLQIMGPLEMRALDFKNLIILSCNEGIFPRHSVAPSFIPADLRHAFELPTYELQDSMWAYYFYRMIQRCDNVWMLYDSRMKNMRAGEVSRFVRQLELHFKVKIDKFFAKSAVGGTPEEDSIPKTAEDIDALRSRSISPSALKAYLFCPAKFYFGAVKRLREDEEIQESLDSRTVGNVFHRTMEELYTVPDGVISAGYLKSLISDRRRVSDIVSGKIKEELNTIEVAGRDIIYRELVLEYVLKTLKEDLKLLEETYRKDSFRILGLEQGASVNIGGFRLYGVIDRLDSFDDGEVRIVDYKTGQVKENDVDINDGNAEQVVRDTFGTDENKRPTIALQLLVYDMFVRGDKRFRGRKIINSVYSPAGFFAEKSYNDPLSEVFYEKMVEGVENLLSEIADTSVPFARQTDARKCGNCPFKILCGR